MPAQIFLNEQDLLALGFIVDDPANWLDGPGRDYPTLAIPGRQGVVFAADPVVAPRTLTIAGTIWPVPQTVTNRVLIEKTLKALAYRALVRVVFDDTITAPIAIDGVCTQCQIRTVGHPQLGLTSRATLTISCPDPTWNDVVGQVVGFNAVPVPVPLGTSPSGGVIRISAPAWSANVTNPVLTYWNSAAVALQTMTFTGVTLTAGLEYLEIDLDRATVVEVSSGVATNAIAFLASGDFFALDPMDGDPLSQSYPMLSCSGTLGTPSGVYLGTRRWL